MQEQVRASLVAAGVAYAEMACDPEVADTAAFCARYGVALEDSANTIVVRSRTGPEQTVACVVLATTRLDVNGVVRRRMGVRKASFLSADVTTAETGMLVGGVTVFGLPPGWPVWVDAAVMAREEIVLGAGSRDAKLRVAPSALLALPDVTVIEDLAT